MKIQVFTKQNLARWIRAALCLTLAVSFLQWRTTAEDAMGPWQKDVQFLSHKIQQMRAQNKLSGGDARKIEQLETQLRRLKELVAQMTELSSQIESKDSRLRYLNSMEIDPKKRELERLTQYYQQRLEEITRQVEALGEKIAEHNGRKPDCPSDGSNAGVCNFYNSEANDLNGRQDSLKSTFVRVTAEAEREIGLAAQAHEKVQQEAIETEAERAKLTEQRETLKTDYASARGPLVEGLVALEVNLPLTPFNSNDRSQNPGLVAVVLPPVGPGTNVHAIDQLRIVTSSSRSSAGRDSHDLELNNKPEEATARIRSGYTFDDEKGLAPADMPEVDLPSGRSNEEAPEPIVVPVSPTAREDTPEAVKNNPKVKEIEKRQQERFKRLGEDYQKLKKLKDQGAEASPTQLTNVYQSIWSNQGGALYDEYLKRTVGGSKVAAKPEPAPAAADINIDVTPKSRRRTSDIHVPPPGEPPPPTKEPSTP